MALAADTAPTVGALIDALAAELEAARVYFGHGTATGRDEAAALIYHVMGLDHEDPGAYDRRLDAGSLARIRALLKERIETRKPLPYVLGEAWFAGLPFYVDERVLIPRSPFAELLTGALYTWIEPDAVRRVLEIGTGCGYQAALLLQLGRHVVSIERLRPLHERARDLLSAMPRSHLRLVHGDGRLGHAPNAPYDTIVAAAGGEDLPPAWLDQLAVGGRLVAPMRSPDGCGQVLVVVDRDEAGMRRRLHEAVQFVPLKSGVA